MFNISESTEDLVSKVNKGKKINKYSHFFPCEQQFEIPEEVVEWVGLSLEEAVEKQRQLEHKVMSHLSFKLVCLE